MPAGLRVRAYSTEDSWEVFGFWACVSPFCEIGSLLPHQRQVSDEAMRFARSLRFSFYLCNNANVRVQLYRNSCAHVCGQTCFSLTPTKLRMGSAATFLHSGASSQDCPLQREAGGNARCFPARAEPAQGLPACKSLAFFSQRSHSSVG